MIHHDPDSPGRSPHLQHAVTIPIKLGQFVGAPAYAQTFEGVSIAESTYAAGRVIAPHAHDAPLVTLVLGGDATEENRGTVRDIRAQSLLFTPAYELHGHRFRNDGRWLNMQFSAGWFARIGAGDTPLPSRPLLIENHAALAWAARVRAELRAPDAVSQLAVEGALLLLITEISRIRSSGERTRPRWLAVVEDAIDASVAEPPSVDALAALAGVNASHLLRTFRRHHGCTMASHVRRRRVERARAEVAAGKRPLSMIALDAGVADQSHFTRVFRQAFGATPGQYARGLRGR
jgi:AraC-like DNA-binding protein/quercetin dioxygenase-like cupin family protein